MNYLPTRLRRDQAVLAAGVLALTGLAWLDLWRRGGMSAGAAMPAGMTQAGAAPWSSGGLAMAVTMWWVMMVAMMLPSSIPALLLFAAQQKRQQGLTALFAAGYLAVWFGWSVVAAAVQGALQGLMLLSPQMAVTSTAAGAAALALAGTYQWTPWKRACLTHCQSPLDFLVRHWKDGPGGAFRMGIQHGLFCVGCCWALMATLFVVGIMNLAWVALLAAGVLVEKAVARGPWFSRVGGVALLTWAGYVAYQGMAMGREQFGWSLLGCLAWSVGP